MDLFIVSVAGIVHKNGKFLVIRRSEKEKVCSGELSYPGGKLCFKDFEREACLDTKEAFFILEKNVKKEIFEETGVIVDEKMTLLNNHIYKRSDGKNALIIVFLCEYLGQEKIKLDESEIKEVLWMKESEIQNSNMDPKFKEIYKEAARVLKDRNSEKELSSRPKKVFKGEIFEVYQWKQKLFDGSYAIFEKLKRPDTVEAICVTKDKKIIIVENIQPKNKAVGLPGGRVEKNESPTEAIKREVLEETGCEIKDENLFLWKKFKPYSRIDWEIFVFVAKDVEKVKEQSLDPGEKIKVKEISFDEFLLLPERKNFRSKEISTELFLARIYERRRKKLQKILFGS